MSSVVLNDATHAHLGSTFDQRLADLLVRASNAIAASRNCEDAVMDALHNLGDAGLHTSVVPQIGHILASLANDDARLLGRHNRPHRELSRRVLFVRLGGRAAVRADVGIRVMHLEILKVVGKVVAARLRGVLRRSHGYR